MASRVYSARAAEAQIWAEQFGSYAAVHSNQGVLTGSPVVTRGNLYLDGLTQYGTWAVPATLLAHPEISFEIRFTPDFDYDLDADVYLFGTSNLNQYYVYKRPNAASNVLRIVLGNTFIADIASATYGPYWVNGSKNVLIISGNGTSTNVWLNGHQILTNDLSTWVPATPTAINIGSNYASNFKFSGIIHHLKIRKRLITQLDATALTDGSLFSYVNKSSVFLSMDTATARAGTIRGTTEELVNGDFSAWTPAGAYENPDGWTATNPGTAANHIEESPTGSMRIVSDGDMVRVIQDPVLVIGRSYRITVVVSAVAGGECIITGTANYKIITTPGVHDFVVVADATRVQIKRGAGLCDFTLDSISIVETDELLSDPDMEADRVGEWVTQNNPTLTKETDSPYQGLQVLRVAYNGTSYPMAYQGPLVATQKYHAHGRARSDSLWTPSLENSGALIWEGVVGTGWQEFDFEFVAIGATFKLRSGATSTGYTEFDSVSVRPVLARTLDKSPYGRVCLLGDGVTAADIPDWLNPGFGLDGVNQYMLMPHTTGVFDSTALTLAFVMSPDFFTGLDDRKYLLQTTPSYIVRKENNTLGNIIQIYLGGTFIANIAEATYSPHWRVDGRNVLVICSVSGSTSAWLNGMLVLDSDPSVWTPDDPSEAYLWADLAAANQFSGVGLGFYLWRDVLSPIQVDDLTLSMMVIP